MWIIWSKEHNGITLEDKTIPTEHTVDLFENSQKIYTKVEWGWDNKVDGKAVLE